MLARRGCNDVISCLSHFIMHTRMGHTGAKWSIWWADNCPGQNKNNYIMWFFYKFLIAGHTYGATDLAFGVIERHIKSRDCIYT